MSEYIKGNCFVCESCPKNEKREEKLKGGRAFEVFWTSETITQAPDVV